jgi:PAS domain S-box-containing protein
MQESERSELLDRYVVALAFALAAILARLALDPVLDNRLPYLLALFAVGASAWYGGAGPGLLTLAVGGLTALFFWAPPKGTFAFAVQAKMFGAGVYCATGLFLILIGQRLRTARERSLESLKASEARLRIALEAGRMGTWDWDVDSDKVTWSFGLEAVHGIAPGKLPASFAAFQRDVHPDDRERVEKAVQRALEVGGERHLEYQLVAQDGSVQWIESRGKPLRDAAGRVYRMIGVSMDITERKRAEAELRQALDLAAEASRAKDQFLAMLSHELRNPLTPVLLAASDMLADPSTPASHRAALAMIRQNVELEVRLIDDLLDVMRIIRGKLPCRFEVVDVHDLIRRTLDICRAEIQAKRIDMRLTEGAPRHHARGDPARLQQVLWNLVKNAVKFTDFEGTIRVRTWNDEAGRINVEVADSGIGIDASSLPRIFNAFEQVDDAATGHSGGLGLGLAISKSIIEAHGGDLAASSEGKGLGSTFRFTLEPIAAAVSGAREDTPKNGASGAGHGLRILLVEDDPITSRIMARLLSQNGYSVNSASTLASALVVPADEIDLVVSDIGLPDGSGCDLMRRIAEARATPGIALTGFGRDDDIQRSLDAGFVAHITKPVDFAELDAMIRRVMTEAAARDQFRVPVRS